MATANYLGQCKTGSKPLASFAHAIGADRLRRDGGLGTNLQLPSYSQCLEKYWLVNKYFLNEQKIK